MIMATAPEIVVAGHICLDIFPTFQEKTALAEFRPGALYHVGPAHRSTGGAVANTGLALHRLGMNVGLCGKVGDDLFGGDILRILTSHAPHLAAGMTLSPGATTSYTIVISPPDIDRTFLHCPGANDTFSADDLNPDLLRAAKLMHFGYPPLMRSMYADGGIELSRLMQKARALGVATSLDMAFPDPASPAGQVDWTSLLQRVLPLVDIFTPSIEELLFMIERPTWDSLMAKGRIDIAADITMPMLHRLGQRLLSMGTSAVMIKLGDQGAYLCSRVSSSKLLTAAGWGNAEAYHPCFQANVIGTTGSGDCTIAGLLTGILRGLPPAESLRLAVAVGACSVEAADATSAVPPVSQVQSRITAGWPKRPTALSL